MKDNTEIKKVSERPADPKLVLEEQKAPAEIALTAFDDGQMMKYMMHPSGKSFAIMGRVGNKQIQLAGTPHQAIAEVICNCVNAMAHATREAQAEPQNPATEEKTNAGQ